MPQLEDIEYTVVLVTPIFGEKRDNAEQIIEEALAWLNTQKDEPGFRFAQNVSARLDIVPDVEQAQAKLQTDDSVAMMILLDLDDQERIDFTYDCIRRGVPVCRTTPAPDSPEGQPRPAPRKRRGWKVVFRSRDEKDTEPPAHTIIDTTLTAPLEDDPNTVMDRVWQLVAVMALGVMDYHFRTNPPQYHLPDN